MTEEWWMGSVCHVNAGSIRPVTSNTSAPASIHVTSILALGMNLKIWNRRSRAMRIRQSFAWLLGAFLLVVSGIAVAQDANQDRTLIVNGQSENVPVIQVNGRSYVDLEALARATNGSLSYSGNQIALNLPNSPANAYTASANTASAPAPPATPASNPGFSQEFLT